MHSMHNTERVNSGISFDQLKNPIPLNTSTVEDNKAEDSFEIKSLFESITHATSMVLNESTRKVNNPNIIQEKIDLQTKLGDVNEENQALRKKVADLHNQLIKSEFSKKDEIIKHLEEMSKKFDELAKKLKEHQEELAQIKQQKVQVEASKTECKKDDLEKEPTDQVEEAATAAVKSPSDVKRELDSKFKATQVELSTASKEFRRFAEKVNTFFNRLNPETLMDSEKGTKLTQLRKEATKLWSHIAHSSYRLNLDAEQISRQISLMPRLQDLLICLNVQNDLISKYMSSNAFKYGVSFEMGAYNYVVDEQKENFQGFIAEKMDLLELYQAEAFAVEKNLESMLSKFKTIELMENYPKQVAKKDKEQAKQNATLFTETRKKAEENQRKIYSEYIKLWSDIRQAHATYLQYITQLEIASKVEVNKDMAFSWTVTVPDNRKLIYTPTSSF